MNENTGHKIVLITGCSSGFGLALAVEAAQKGYEVIATMRNLAKVSYLRDSLSGLTDRVTIDELDTTSPESIDRIIHKYPPFDILINNAGILIAGSFLDITDNETRRIFETNYFGPVRLARAVAAGMIEKRSGLIINIASLAGRVGHPYNAAYSASKHALVGFSRSIHIELAPFNVKVACVEPGYHKTEIIRANANLTENFYNSDSPMFEYNRGFLRLMHDKIVPNAGEVEDVVRLILKIMQTPHPHPEYIVGKDARLAVWAYRLGLGKLLRKEVLKRIATAVRRENRRAESRRAKRRKKTEAPD